MKVIGGRKERGILIKCQTCLSCLVSFQNIQFRKKKLPNYPIGVTPRFRIFNAVKNGFTSAKCAEERPTFGQLKPQICAVKHDGPHIFKRLLRFGMKPCICNFAVNCLTSAISGRIPEGLSFLVAVVGGKPPKMFECIV